MNRRNLLGLIGASLIVPGVVKAEDLKFEVKTFFFRPSKNPSEDRQKDFQETLSRMTKGSTLYIAKGEYYFDDSIVISRGDITIIGNNEHSKLRVNNKSDGLIVVKEGVENLTLMNLWVEGCWSPDIKWKTFKES